MNNKKIITRSKIMAVSSTLLFLCIIVIGMLSCSNNSPTDPSQPEYPDFSTLLDNVQFEPSSGPPGTMVSMIGLDDLPADSGFALSIGNQPAPLLPSPSSPIKTAIPIYLDTSVSSWPTTPDAPQTVTLFYHGVPVDSVPDAIQVDSLFPTPGAIDTVLTKLSSGSQALKQIAMSLQSPDTLLLATCDAMDELLYTGTYSLKALLAGTAPIEGYDSSVAGLFGALLSSSGAVDIISRWSDTLQVAAGIARRMAANSTSAARVSDQTLADRMQLHDFLEGFGTNVIGQTALQWQYVSAVLGAVAVAAPVVGVYEFIVSWVLGEMDFIVNKIAIAMLPSDVTRLELDFYNHEITVGDTTEAIVRISAKNNPPNITPADIIGQILGGLQLTQWVHDRLGPTTARTLIDIIKNIVNWALGVITNILSANYNSPTSLDVALPAVTWDSVWIHNPGLIDLMSPDLSKIDYINGSFNGRAKDSLGPVGLQMRTQPPGPSTYTNSILASLGYVGGAFGNDLTTSNIDTITVVGELALEVDFANTITVGGANVLGLNAGYLDRNGYPHWDSNIQINLTVTDGTASTTSGVTDAQGHFSSIIQIDSTADSVTVHIFAYGEYNSQTDTVVVARTNSNTSSINEIYFRNRVLMTTQADSMYRSETQRLDTIPFSYPLPDSNDEIHINYSESLNNSLPWGNAAANNDMSFNITLLNMDTSYIMTETFSATNGVSGHVNENGHQTMYIRSYYSIDVTYYFRVKGTALVEVAYDSGPASSFIINSVFLGNIYDGMNEIISDGGSWYSVMGEGLHSITFRQSSDVNGALYGIGSYSENKSSYGTLTVTLRPQ